MVSLQRILVAIDDSPSADTAISYALWLAHEHDAEVIFCNAVNYAATVAETASPYVYADIAGLYEALDLTARGILNAALARARADGAVASAFKLDGRADDALVRYAVEAGVAAIVIGTRGENGLGRFFLGSTADGVLRASPVPVWVVHAGCAVPDESAVPRPGTIVVAVDDSDPSDAAVAFAASLVTNGESRLLLANVVDTNARYESAARYGSSYKPVPEDWIADGRTLVHAAAEKARAGGARTVDESVLTGEPVEQILELARTSSASLIAIGTHGRRGLNRMLMGSVAEQVVRRSTVPVVVVRAADEAAALRGSTRAGTAPPQLVTA